MPQGFAHKPFSVILVQAGIALAVLVAATFLAATDKLQGEAVTALFGMAIALAGQTASAASQASAGTGPNPPTRITTPQGVTVETNGAIGTTERLAAEDTA
jgi:hypothetical protein